jgi:polar amino acid transport system substrate-binding protein
MSLYRFSKTLLAGLLLTGSCLLAAPVQAAETIYLVTTAYPPYYGPDLPKNGVITQIVTEALKRGGYTLKVDWLPWARALHDAQDGKADGAMGIWRSKEREQYFVYSSAMAPNQIGFYKRADAPISFKALSDLKPYKIGVVRGYANPKAFDDAKLTTDEAGDDEANLRKLGAGRIDLVLIDKGVAMHLIDSKLHEYKGKLVWLDPAVDKLPMYVGFSKKAPGYEKKLAAFNKGLKEMEADGTLAKLISQAGI